MTAKLIALLFFVGPYTFNGNTVNVYVPRPSTTVADLADAGAGTYFNTKRSRTCTVFADDSSDCPDGGAYCQAEFAFRLSAPDGGVRDLLTTIPNAKTVLGDDVQCGGVQTTSLTADQESYVGFSCACASSSACKLTDGGAAPMGVTMQPGTFTASAACVPKACVERFGVSSWPAACP